MTFQLPAYQPPDFTQPPFVDAPPVTFKRVAKAGVAPDDYHATSIHPEYFQVEKGRWSLLEQSRMDGVVVQRDDGSLVVREFRKLARGDRVACGRRENGEDGILVHAEPFESQDGAFQKFAFRTRTTRETSFSIDYDELYDLLEFERRNGFIVWALGPAVVFDRDSREAFTKLVAEGYVHALLAGNALAVHDVEAALFATALGQGIYAKKSAELGHYNHLDAINRVRAIGSIEKAIDAGIVGNGIMKAVIENDISYVLAGSIRDDGPLPETIADACQAQDRMRAIARRATTVIGMATVLHTIATGNMVPAYQVTGSNGVRPVYFYSVDMSEFAVSKLVNRGSLAARAILTNVQDFVVTVERGLRRRTKGFKG